MSSNSVRTRALAVDGLDNIRDLGGLTTRSGATVKSRRVLRSDSLGRATPAGAAMLADDLGVRLVIDLRTPAECEREGISPLESAEHRYVNIILVPQAALNEEEAAQGKATNLVDDYLMHLTVSPAPIIEILERLADPANHPAVVHCTAGKDRTGIAVAILLDILGVDTAVIAADYAETAPAMASVLARIRSSEFFRSTGLAAAPAWIFEAKSETMQQFLDTLHARYGGAEQWALSNGMDPALPGRLRATLLEPL